MRRGNARRNVCGTSVHGPWGQGKREKKQSNVRERQMVRRMIHSCR